jgi:hypothetical protein
MGILGTKHLAFQCAGGERGELVVRLERGMLYNRAVKTHSENHGRVRRRKSPDAVNSKLIMAAVRLWELKRRTPR